jgi:hypothetical protein
LSAAGDTIESIATPNETNEPTDARENVASEPTLSTDVGLESQTYMKATEQNATIEPTPSTPSGGRQVGEMYLARHFSMGGRASWRATASARLSKSFTLQGGVGAIIGQQTRAAPSLHRRSINPEFSPGPSCFNQSSGAATPTC